MDAVWALGLGFGLSLLFIYLSPLRLFSIVALALVLVWSIRLGVHLILRLSKHFPIEDRRYATLKLKWAGGIVWKSFAFFQIQGITQVVLCLPFVFIFSDVGNGFNGLSCFGAVIVLIGLVGETVADLQLKEFKKQSDSDRNLCEIGLWKYSRHPNYFFEWLVWVGFGIFAFDSSHGVSLISPVVMYFLLVYVTGVQAAERELLRSKGVAFERYQKQTNAFFIWRRKSGRTVDAE